MLLQLPRELQDGVFALLDVQALAALRLTSKEHGAAVLPLFCSRYFATRYVMFSRPSLRNLATVSRHPTFGPAVKEVEVCVDHLSDEPSSTYASSQYPDDPGDPGVRFHTWEKRTGIAAAAAPSIGNGRPYWWDDALLADEAAYNTLRADQEAMWKDEGKEYAAYLRDALQGLPGLETMTIGSGHRPWGALAIERRTGILPTNDISEADSPEIVRGILRVALSVLVSLLTPPRRLCIEAGRHEEFGITPHMLRLPANHPAVVHGVPSALTSLSLTLFAGASTVEQEGYEREADDVLRFLALFPHIERLRLEFPCAGSAACMAQIFGGLRQVSLQYLALDSLSCKALDLAALLRRHSTTLQEVCLTYIQLLGDKLKDEPEDEPKEEYDWAWLFHILCRELSLQVLSVKRCTAGNQCLLIQDGDDGFIDEFIVDGRRDDWDEVIRRIRGAFQVW